MVLYSSHRAREPFAGVRHSERCTCIVTFRPVQDLQAAKGSGERKRGTSETGQFTSCRALPAAHAAPCQKKST